MTDNKTTEKTKEVKQETSEVKEEKTIVAGENPGEVVIEVATKQKGKKGKIKKKRKVRKMVTMGNVYIKATYNNTIVTIADQTGNVIASSSAGANGFKGPKKATPFAASIIVKDAVTKALPYGMKDVNVFVKGVGMGRESAVRGLNANGLNVLSIKDITPIPHNGCRKKKPRRV